MADDVRADHRPEPQFSQPVRQVVMMLVVLGLTAACAILLYPQLAGIFAASPYLRSSSSSSSSSGSPPASGR